MPAAFNPHDYAWLCDEVRPTPCAPRVLSAPAWPLPLPACLPLWALPPSGYAVHECAQRHLAR